MKNLSTGDPSTLGSYLKLAKVFGTAAVGFIQKKIDESPNGADEVVIAEEGQMLHVLANIAAAQLADKAMGNE